MRTLVAGLGMTIALLCAVPGAHAQKATERYIPLGRSPGLSGKYNWIGTIADVSARAQTITIADSTGSRTVQISKQTRIWLDRTALKQSNLTGRFADLQKGRRIEIKYLDAEQRQKADWVKVEVTQP
jgi:hypothetical protein